MRALVAVALTAAAALAEERSVTLYNADGAGGAWCWYYGTTEQVDVLALETMPYVAGPLFLGDAARDVVALPGDRLLLVVASVLNASLGCYAPEDAAPGSFYDRIFSIDGEPLSGAEVILGWSGDVVIAPPSDEQNAVLVNAGVNDTCVFSFDGYPDDYQVAPGTYVSVDLGCRDQESLSVVCGDLETNATYRDLCRGSERHHVASLSEGLFLAYDSAHDASCPEDSCPGPGGGKKKKSKGGLETSEVVAIAVLVPVAGVALLVALIVSAKSNTDSASAKDNAAKAPETAPAGGEVEMEEAKKGAAAGDGADD